MNEERQFYRLVYHGLFFTLTLSILLALLYDLRKRSKPFFDLLFPHKAEAAESANQLKHLGFFIFCLAALFFLLPFGITPNDAIQILEEVSFKVGVFLILLALIQFVNVKNYWKISTRK